MTQRAPTENRVPELRDILPGWEEVSALFLARCFRSPDKIREAGITVDMIAPAHSQLARVILAHGGENMTGALAEAGLAVEAVRLPDPGPMPTNALAREVRRHHANYLMASAIQARDLKGIQTAIESRAATPKDKWAMAKSLFPRKPTPWHLYPADIAESMKQLARSCATTNTSLAGATLAVLASAIGRKMSIAPKQSWREPFILWIGDIRESGEGKTPSGRALMAPFYARQKREHERFEAEQREFEMLTPKERKAVAQPKKPRGFFVTEMTLEGLRDELHNHPTGGLFVLLDELSAFISGQGQYKSGKGSDRESWLLLHDGNPARVSRAGKTVLLSGSRVQLFGGIQPEIFKMAFSGKEGSKFQHDGTLYRMLTIFEGPTFSELTSESWTRDNKEAWSRIIESALDWAEAQDKTADLLLSDEAQTAFNDWRNDLFAKKPDLPPILRGYLPKITGYALRLAGLLWILRTLSEGHTLSAAILSPADIMAGIELAEWFFSNAVEAVHFLVGQEQAAPTPVSSRDLTLAQTLEEVKDEAEHGRLGVGWLREQFNERAGKHDRFGSPHAFGAYLPSKELNISAGNHDFHGSRRVKCLLLDEKTKSFEKSCLQSLNCLQSKQSRGFTDSDKLSAKSELSASTGRPEQTTQTLQTSDFGSLQVGSKGPQGFSDNSDFADNFSSQKNFSDVEVF